MAELRTLIAASAAHLVEIRAMDAGLAIVVRSGRAEFVLKARRGGVRLYKSIDGAAGWVRTELGVKRIELDLRRWTPHQGAALDA